MIYRSLRAFALSLPALMTLGLLTTSLPRCAAQMPTTTDKQPKDDKSKTPTKTEKEKTDNAPPANNPLVLINPENGSGNAAKQFERDGKRKRNDRVSKFGDYRQDDSDPRQAKKADDLPLFGYDFFEPARRLIDARYNYLLNSYQNKRNFNPFSTKQKLRARTKGTDKDNKDKTGKTRADQNTDDDGGLYDEKNRTGKRPPTPKKKKSDTDTTRRNRDADADTDATANDKTSDQTDSANGTRADSDRPTVRRPRRTRASHDSSDSSDTEDSTQQDDTDNPDDTQADDNAPRRPRTRRSPYDDDSSYSDDMSDSTTGRYSTDDSLLNNPDDYTDEDQRQAALLARRRRAQLLRQSQGRTTRRSPSDLTDDTGAYADDYTQDDLMADDLTPSSASRSQSRTTRSNGSRTYRQGGEPVDALRELADPITQLYRNVAATAPTTYQLAGGDVITVRYSSPTMDTTTLDVTVDAQGNLVMPDLTPINVSGMTLAQAQTQLQQRLRRVYKNAEVTLNLQSLRSITVTVGGKAYVPGSYTVPAVATVFNVLWAAGGPTEDGSLRNVQVLRQGKLIGTLDVYKYVTGQGQSDIRLQSGDLITIPAALSRVAVRGDVRDPAQFELKDSETLKDALNFAGGVKPSGVDQFVQVNTVKPGVNRILKSVNIHEASVGTTPLYDGDSVEIFSMRPQIVNKVTIEGAVDQPSDYAMEDGMRVADLIRRARGPIDEAFLSRAELYRWNPNNTTTLIPVNLEKALAGDPSANIPLTRWDRLKVYTRQEVAWAGHRKVTVSGAVQRPGVYDLSENMHVSDLLMMVGGPSPEASLDQAFLLHQYGDGSFKYEKIALADALHGDKSADTLVQDNDLLAVYKVGEAKVTREHFVTISGEVNTPGLYPRGEGMRLTDLVAIAGGFKPNADPSVTIAHAGKVADGPDASIKTVSVAFDSQQRCAPQDDLPLNDGDVITVQGHGGYQEKPVVVYVKGVVNKVGPVILKSRTARLSDALKEAGGLRPEAFPEGAEFFRDPKMLATAGQRDLAVYISRLNNLLNDSAYKRELAKSDVERIKAAGAAQDSSTLSLNGAGAQPNLAAGALATQLSQHDLVSKPRILHDDDLQPNGNIAVNLPEALRKPGGSEDILLVDGDTITVPKQPTTVQVVGAVVNGRGVFYKPGANLDYYVAQAGGFAPDAAKDRIYVIHAGGGLLPANHVRELRPGDVILVTNKVLAEKITSRGNSLDSLFRSVANSAILYRLATGIFGL